MEKRNIKVKDLEVNKGQIFGLPKNPRFIRDHRFAALKKSIEDAPEMLAYRTLLVYPSNGKYVIICGNMRYRACKDIGYAELPCTILPEDTPVAKLREYTIKDNIGFGSDDMDALANEWESEELKEWGLEIAGFGVEESEVSEEAAEESEVSEEINEEEEALLRETMVAYCKEFISNIDKLLENDCVFASITPSFARMRFIRSKYNGLVYPSYCSLAFILQQIKTRASKNSVYEQMSMIANGETTAGVADLLTVTTNGKENLERAIKGNSYPFGGARLPLDFPVDLARQLIKKYSKGGRILDPCHGWGGRCTAAMLEEVELYVGVDPSPYAHKGLEKIKSTFADLSKTDVLLYEMPFEDTKLKKESFDFALTSPPYFDVEQYDGEETSTRRYNNFELWCEKFYKQLIAKTYDYLKSESYFALQVGNQSYPLKEFAIKYGEEVGFKASVEDNVIRKASNNLHNNEDGENLVLLYKQ